MNNAFFNMDIDKQQRIINSSFQEFSNYGYTDASTNRIVIKAGISKGSLFYYFKNKQDLLNFLFKYAIEYLTENYVAKIDTTIPDFFERYKLQRSIKNKIFTENPFVFSFISSYYYVYNNEMNLPLEIIEQLKRLEDKINNSLYQNIDISMFREDIEISELFRYFKWLMYGYEKELMIEVGDNNISSVDWNFYLERDYSSLDNLRRMFYKKDYEEV
ncbi:TetR/AcrR family transcriptional regulator [Bacillus sp. FJAT-52991]|uniref:TetR/AcrR family transcriptional regulator n=1 Tax=Bacillus kandeliae TaxID=3129297 RepID=A0ABZ2N4A2_9BACI